MSYVIKKPLITEKNSMLGEKNIYVFEVSRQSTKTDIKEHIEKYFTVKVQSVKTSIGRRDGRRTKAGAGKVVYYKKAFVRLKKDERIQLFEGN